MKINYIILAHKNPEQLKRLILKLNDSYTNFYIHIDKNSKIDPFKDSLREFDNVFLLKGEERFQIIWGDISIVKATLNALYKISLENKSDYCILLSGQDYPLRSSKSIREFLNKNTGENFVSLFSLPNSQWENGGLNRLNRYKINKSSNRKHFLFLPSLADREFYSKVILGKLNFLRKTGKIWELLKIFQKRRFPKYLQPFGGGQWWALTTGVVEQILKFHENHPDYIRYHQYTLIPDEIFFHSILAELAKRNHLQISPSLTYTDWSREWGPLPVTFTKDDFNDLKGAAEKHLFARKFDITTDMEILNLIDSDLLLE